MPLKGPAGCLKWCWQCLQRVLAAPSKGACSVFEGAGSAFEGCRQRLQRVLAAPSKGACSVFEGCWQCLRSNPIAGVVGCVVSAATMRLSNADI